MCADKTVVLNAGRVNYDGKAGFEGVASEVTLYEDTPPELIPQRAQGHRVLVTKELPVTAETIRRLPDTVQLICEAGTGYNNIDLAAARARGVSVCNVPAYSSERVAQTVFLLLLNLASSMTRQQRMLARGDHSNFTRFLQVDHLELNGKTLGVVGAGHIGGEVIRIAQAMGMQTVATTRRPRPDAGGGRYLPLERLLAESDVVSLHCPLTPDTRHLIDAAAIARMKPTAFLINTARGALVDEPALIEALQQGRLAGAGLDVQESEPPAEDSPLYRLENVVLTPHMGWKGLETRRRLVARVAENIRAFCAGSPINLVN